MTDNTKRTLSTAIDNSRCLSKDGDNFKEAYSGSIISRKEILQLSHTTPDYIYEEIKKSTNIQIIRRRCRNPPLM